LDAAALTVAAWTAGPGLHAFHAICAAINDVDAARTGSDAVDATVRIWQAVKSGQLAPRIPDPVAQASWAAALSELTVFAGHVSDGQQDQANVSLREAVGHLGDMGQRFKAISVAFGGSGAAPPVAKKSEPQGYSAPRSAATQELPAYTVPRSAARAKRRPSGWPKPILIAASIGFVVYVVVGGVIGTNAMQHSALGTADVMLGLLSVLALLIGGPVAIWRWSMGRRDAAIKQSQMVGSDRDRCLI